MPSSAAAAAPQRAAPDRAAMRLGVVAALPAELRTYAGRVPGAGALASHGDIAWVALCGMGSERAHAAGQQLLIQGVRALVSWGTAGALVEGLAPGNLVLPVTVISARGETLPVTREWHERLSERLAGRIPLATQPLAESPTVLAAPAEKRALAGRTGAVAVDMESATLAHLAHEAGIGFLAVRAIVDRAELALPTRALRAIDPWGRAHPLALMSGLLAAPREWGALARLATGFRAARATLAAVRRHAGADLLCP